MSEKKVLQQEELDQIINVKKEFQDLIEELGKIEAKKVNLELKKEDLINKLIDLQYGESELMKKLETKYGKGNISLETGEFTPNK
jgi:hypothetical protein